MTKRGCLQSIAPLHAALLLAARVVPPSDGAPASRHGSSGITATCSLRARRPALRSIGNIHQLERADATRIPVGEQQVNLLILALAGDIPRGVVQMLGVGVTEFFLGLDGGGNSALFEIDDVERPGGF